MKKKIIIIGGGLSGLTLAYLLSKHKIETTILEASSRLGGRIQTKKGELETPLELGATWFSDVHRHFLALLEELGLQKYKQYSKGKTLFQTKRFEPPQLFDIPDSENPSYRLVGGTQRLIDTLANQLDKKSFKLNTEVTAIKDLGKELEISISDQQIFLADKVILCMPPQLANSKIQFSPTLPDSITNILPTVQTWMAGSIKFVLEYEKPFWRNNGYSGMLFSHFGIITEMYDHTNYEENKFGFTGFLNSGYASHSNDARKKIVLQQLTELLGQDAMNYSSYFDKVWTDEFILGGNQIIQRSHQNNGHPLLHKSYMHNNLFFSGTETANQYSGYMEGAIISALKIMQQLVAIQ